MVTAAVATTINTIRVNHNSKTLGMWRARWSAMRVLGIEYRETLSSSNSSNTTPFRVTPITRCSNRALTSALYATNSIPKILRRHLKPQSSFCPIALIQSQETSYTTIINSNSSPMTTPPLDYNTTSYLPQPHPITKLKTQASKFTSQGAITPLRMELPS